MEQFKNDVIDALLKAKEKKYYLSTKEITKIVNDLFDSYLLTPTPVNDVSFD